MNKADAVTISAYGPMVHIALAACAEAKVDADVLDGWDATQFVQEVKRLHETPALLFAD